MPGVTGFGAWPDFSAVEMDGYWFVAEAAAAAVPWSLASTLVPGRYGAVR
jgi:hypothetical protein